MYARVVPSTLCFFRQAEFTLEAVDAAACIHQFLFSGEKGVTLRADFHSYVLFGGSGLYRFTAGTADSCRDILRMNAVLHYVHLNFKSMSGL